MKTYLGLRVFESWTRYGLTGAYISFSPAAPVRAWIGENLLPAHLHWVGVFVRNQSHLVLTTQQLAFTPRPWRLRLCLRDPKAQDKPLSGFRSERTQWKASSTPCLLVVFTPGWCRLPWRPAALACWFPRCHPNIRVSAPSYSVLLSVPSAHWWGNHHRCESGQTAGWPAKASAPKQQVGHPQCVQSIQVVHTLDKKKAQCTTSGLHFIIVPQTPISSFSRI